MSKGVKKTLGFVASIFIPFAAPAIAGAIGMAGWLGSAVVGAGLGAANAALTGGNVAQGALFGGIGGGLSAGLSGAPMIGQAGTAAMPGVQTVAGGANLGIEGTMMAKAQAAQAAANAAKTAGLGIEGTMVAARQAAMEAAKQTTLFDQFASAVSQIPTKIGEAITNPDVLTDLTLRASAMLIPGLMTSDPLAGISDEERQLVELRKQELLEMQQTNKQLFDQQLALANQVISEAKQFDPRFFAQQQAKEQQLRGGAMAQEAAQTYGRGQEAALNAEQRRIALGTGRNMASAYGEGLAQGELMRQNKLQAGLNMRPTQAPSGAYGTLLAEFAPYRERADTQQAGLQETFTDWITRSGLTTPASPKGKSLAKPITPKPSNKGKGTPSSVGSFNPAAINTQLNTPKPFPLTPS